MSVKSQGVPDAIIFDFDGVIADTEPLHYRTFNQVVQADGLTCTWDEYVTDYIGYDDRDLFRVAYKKNGLELSDAALAEKMACKEESFVTAVEQGVAAYEGIPDVLHALQPITALGLCSGALRSDIDAVLSALNLPDLFPVRVTAEDVTYSKPDPACYRLAVARLAKHTGRNLSPDRCIAIEDTPAGLQSAKAAGLQAWAVTHTHSKDQLVQADKVFSCLRDILEAFPRV